MFKRDEKYKWQGITLVILVVFFLIFYFKPKPGINFYDISEGRIDSVGILNYENMKSVTVIEKAITTKLSEKMKNSAPTEVEAINVSILVYHLTVYSKKNRMYLDLIDSHFNGNVFRCNQVYYKNEDLSSFVNKLYGQNIRDRE